MQNTDWIWISKIFIEATYRRLIFSLNFADSSSDHCDQVEVGAQRSTFQQSNVRLEKGTNAQLPQPLRSELKFYNNLESEIYYRNKI